MAKPARSKVDLIRQAAEESLSTFIRLVAPHRVLGLCHEELISWWTRDESKSHQLILMPRDHQKSALVAYRVAWEITKNPAMTILYISSTANLAEKQLKFIKDILTSHVYRRYWPEMVNIDEGKREKWTSSEISVDHPYRKKEGVRDPTIFTAGLTTSITGLHCNLAVLDDVVVQENAYTREGREKVKSQYSLLASIETTDAREWAVGTRYHPDDLYSALIEMGIELEDEDGLGTELEPVYEVFQREVEDLGDGTGEFLWPRQQRADGKWFGFNNEILAKKRAQYLDRFQFRAQYYNNPNDPDNEVVSRDLFQYYDRKYLEYTNGKWSVNGKILNVYAAIDFAFSLSSTADYTAIVVVGVDALKNIYVLDVVRFKTTRISEYFENILQSHVKWNFRKIRCEVTVAQAAITQELRERIRLSGLAMSIDEFRPTARQGSKEERMSAILNPRYENHQIWHYKGGMCQELEEEVKSAHPKHDDIKDALASCIEIAIPPQNYREQRNRKVVTHPRFGGVAFA